MNGSFTIMGSAGSMGIPVIGCDCSVCTSSNKRNCRLRSGCLVKYNHTQLLIDASTDLRFQALKYGIKQLDAILITHAHQDHVGGVDDLRPFFFYHKGPIPCYMSQETFYDLNQRFGYIFSPKKITGTILPKLDVQIFSNVRGSIIVDGLEIKYFTFSQVGMSVNGFRFGDLAYVSDIKEYPDTIFEDLKGVKTLILSALRYEPTHIHFTVDDACKFAEKVGAKKTWLTHIAHELDHDKTNDYLPDNIEMAYDGLDISFKF